MPRHRVKNHKRQPQPIKTFPSLLRNITQSHDEQFYDNNSLVFTRVMDEAVRQNIPSVSKKEQYGEILYLVNSIELNNFNLDNLHLTEKNNATKIVVELNQCTLNNVSMNGGNFNDNLYLVNCQFNQLSMRSATFNFLDLYSEHNSTNTHYIDCTNSSFARLQIVIPKNTSGTLLFDGATIENGSFSGTVPTSFNNCAVSNFSFNNRLETQAVNSSFSNVFFLLNSSIQIFLTPNGLIPI